MTDFLKMWMCHFKGFLRFLFENALTRSLKVMFWPMRVSNRTPALRCKLTRALWALSSVPPWRQIDTPGDIYIHFATNWLSWYNSFTEFVFLQFHQVMCFHLSICSQAIYRNAFRSNSTICHQFWGNSVLVNERDGGGNVSITAGLVLNELHMYLLSLLECLCVFSRCVCACVFCLRGSQRGRAEIIEKKKKLNKMSIW